MISALVILPLDTFSSTLSSNLSIPSLILVDSFFLGASFLFSAASFLFAFFSVSCAISSRQYSSLSNGFSSSTSFSALGCLTTFSFLALGCLTTFSFLALGCLTTFSFLASVLDSPPLNLASPSLAIFLALSGRLGLFITFSKIALFSESDD